MSGFQHDDGCMADYYDPDYEFRGGGFGPVPDDEPEEPHGDKLLFEARRGSIVEAILGQTATWWDKQGVEHPVKDIDPGYARNIVRFLEARAHTMKWAVDMRAIALTSGPLGPSGDAANDAVDAELDRLFDTHPLKWLHEQPLVVALRARAAA